MAKKPLRLKLSRRKKLLFTLAVFVPALVLIELGMRLCGYGPLEIAEDGPIDPLQINAFQYFTICDPELGFRNRKNGKFTTRHIAGHPVSSTDQHGYRNGFGWSAKGDSPIVLFVGDSITFCSEVNDDRTGPSEVAKLLAEEFDVRVLNAAVRGYGTLQSKRMLRECLRRFATVQVVVYTHCGNDVEETMIPNLRTPAKAPAMLRDPETGAFREVEVSQPAVPWGEDFLAWRPPPPPTIAGKVTRWIETRSALCRHFIQAAREIRVEFVEIEFPDGRSVVPLKDFGMWNHWARHHGGNEVMQRLLGEMQRISRDHGAALITTTFANGTEIQAADCFAKNCEAAGVPFVDLRGAFQDDPRSYGALREDGEYDTHYGPLGTKTYAAALTPALIRILREQMTTAEAK